jgi:hypothetical protein
MKLHQIVRVVALASLAAIASSRPALAGLHIDLVSVGNAPPPEPALLVGGGDLNTIMRVAAQAWERVFRNGGDPWNVTIEYSWAELRPGLWGEEKVLAQGGTPIRITRARVLFNNKPTPPEDGIAGFFADPTPWKSSEYLRYTSDRRDVTGGQLNIGRVFSEATGDAEGRIDLLTIATHEIGHALGLDYDYVGFQSQIVENILIDVTAPRPLAGLELLIGFGPHLGGFGETPLMVLNPHPGWRQLISGADALLIAQVSAFDGLRDVDALNDVDLSADPRRDDAGVE